MKILVTGSEGYIGQVLCDKLSRKFGKDNIIKVDNLSRHTWVNHVTQVCSYLGSNEFIAGDITDMGFIDEILKIHKPDCIIHLASQPSMPYSQLSWERAKFTQENNLLMCLNLLWGIKENNLNTRFIITTTTGIPGQYYENVPENHTMNFAGSWYHVSRGFDSANCNLASRQFGIKILEFRTSIVYGLTANSNFDTDFYFGTVLNRFIKQAISGKDITVYGKGEQIKPFISINDCCDSIVNGVNYEFSEKHLILNQVTEHISIKDLAILISDITRVNVKYIPNPRQEKEDFKMFFENKRFLQMLISPPETMAQVIENMIHTLKY